VARKPTNTQPLTVEQWRLVTENTGLGYQALYNYMRRHGYWWDDDVIEELFHDVSLPSLIRAARYYRPERGWRFSTYAMNALIRGMHIRVQRHFGTRPGKPRVLPETDHGYDGWYEDTVASATGPPLVVLQDEVAHVLAPLNDRERFILWQTQALGTTRLHVASMLGIHRERVRQLEAGAIAKVRKAWRRRA